MNKIRYKLLVLDIDGTILDGKGNISAEDSKAIAAAVSAGVKVSLSTGRSVEACLKVIEWLSLDGYHISFDGALVSNPELGDEVYAQPLNGEIVREMVEFAHAQAMDLELFSSTTYFVERETWSTKAHREFFGIEPTIVNYDRIWERERIIKAALVGTNAGEEAMIAGFRSHFAGRLRFSQARTPAYPGVTFHNILAPDVSKGKALEALASHLGISLAEVMAVGDGSNDIPLLAAAGLAVAMGNASAEVKAIADYVTLDVDHSGLAAAIARFLL